MGQQGKHGERFSARQKGRWQSLYFIWTCLALVNTAPSLKDLASSQRQPPAPTWSCCPAPRALHRGEQEHAVGHGATPQGACSGTWGDTARSRSTQRDMGRHHGERAAGPGSAFCSALMSEPLPVAIPLCPGEQRWGAAQAPELTSSPTAGCLGVSTLIGASGSRLTARFRLSQGTEQLQCHQGGAGLVQPWLQKAAGSCSRS